MKRFIIRIMLSYDREVVLLVAVVVCVVGTMFLYREYRNTRREVNDLKMYSTQMAQYVNSISNYEDESEEEEEVEIQTKEQPQKIEDSPEK